MLKRVRFILWRVLPLAALAVAVAACSSAPAAQPTIAPNNQPPKAAATAPQPTDLQVRVLHSGFRQPLVDHGPQGSGEEGCREQD